MHTVVGLVARCEVDDSDVFAEGRPRQSFRVSESLVLADGGEVLLHDERGFTAWVHGDGDVWASLSADGLRADVLTTVLPDDDGPDEHPWAWLVELAALRGVGVTADELRAVPYEVVLGPVVLGRLS